MIDLKELEHIIFLKVELQITELILTLHKLEEFLSGEIHEEMNEGLRLKEQDLKLKNLN